MAIETLYMTDDLYRPDDGNGNPIEQSNSELSVSIDGYQYHWYFSARCIYDLDDANLNARLRAENYLFLNGSSPSSAPTLRFVLQTSSNDFSTYHQEIIESDYQGSSVIIRSRSSMRALNRQYGSSYNRYGTKTLQMSDLGLSDIQYKVRCKIQRKVNNTWTDVVRGGTHGSDPWKTLASYAPFYQSVTPPTHFYANGINTFGATIKANHKFICENNLLESSGGSYFYYNSNKVVRNITPPYVTEGVETQYLYWCPGHSVSEQGQYQKYSMVLQTNVPDPSDSNYTLIVAYRTVTGNIEYKETDDLSMYGTPTWTIADTSGMYEEYGLFLRNKTTHIVLSMDVPRTYGAGVNTRYSAMNYDGYFPQENSQFIPVTIPLSSYGYSASIHVRVYAVGFGSALLDETVLVQIENYSVPSLPTASIHRCDSDGTANDNGEYCRIDWAVAITPINNQNHKKLTIRHPGGTTEYDQLDSYTQSGNIIVAASTESTYGIEFIVSDDLDTTTKSLRLSTAHAIMDLLYGGGGVAFGKVASMQNAVEISELWKLITYQLSLNGIDMNKWVKQLESRVTALEEFAGNTGSTTQFQVSFYNDTELLKRDWVRSGSDATAPSEDPERESTNTNTYSFAGWTLTNGKTSADSGALENITNHRNIYAAFVPATRYYTVNFKSDGIPVVPSQELQYRYSATAPSTNPSKSGYTFAGWCPSGRIITKDTDAIAQFFDNTEITDSWETIMDAVDDGSASSKYHQGQYKTLDCGSNGTVVIRIKGFNLDKIANSEKKAYISWEAVECLSTLRRMNPTYSVGIEGTGALGGWEKSELRQWLNSDFFNSIDPVVRNKIKNVSKVSYSRDVNGTGVANKIVTDKVSIPSAEEIVGHYRYRQYNYSNVYETEGIDFRYMTYSFSTRRANGSASNIDYWLRTVANVGHDSFICCRDLLNLLSGSSEEENGICVCFCT